MLTLLSKCASKLANDLFYVFPVYQIMKYIAVFSQHC